MDADGSCTVECSVCLDPLTTADHELDDEVLALSCSHVFHTRCLRGCVDHGCDTCPLCRAELDVDARAQLYRRELDVIEHAILTSPDLMVSRSGVRRLTRAVMRLSAAGVSDEDDAYDLFEPPVRRRLFASPPRIPAPPLHPAVRPSTWFLARAAQHRLRSVVAA